LLSRVKEEHGLRAFENRILRKILGWYDYSTHTQGIFRTKFLGLSDICVVNFVWRKNGKVLLDFRQIRSYVLKRYGHSHIRR
jgi:hypothetical protein